MDSTPKPKLRFLHSQDALNPAKLETFRRLPSGAIKLALQPGQPITEGSARWNGSGWPSSTVGTSRTRRDHRSASARDNGKRIMSSDLFWIPGPWRDRLAIGARPRGGDWLEGELRGLRRAGIDVLVALLESDEAAQLDLLGEPGAAEANGIRFVSFPIPDRGVPASMPATSSLMAGVASALDEGRNVAMHCRQGIGRSGLIAAAVLIGPGVGSEDAIKAVSSARGIAVPETNHQLLWVQQLPSRLSVATR